MTPKILRWYSDMTMTTNNESDSLIDEAIDFQQSFIIYNKKKSKSRACKSGTYRHNQLVKSAPLNRHPFVLLFVPFAIHLDFVAQCHPHKILYGGGENLEE